MSLTNREIIEGVIRNLEELRDLISFEGGTGVADFSDWLEDIDGKLREADAASAMEWEKEREQDDGE